MPLITSAARARTPVRVVVSLLLAMLMASACTTENPWPIQESEVFSGTMWLTDESPQVDLAVTLTLDGEPAEKLDTIVVETRSIRFGGADSSEQDLTVERQLTAPGEGIVSIGLANAAAAPIQVHWTASVVNYGSFGEDFNPFDDKAAQVPVLTVEAGQPERLNRPDRFTTIDVGWDSWEQPAVRRVRIDEGTSAMVYAAWPFPDDELRYADWSIRIGTEDGESVRLMPGSTAALPRPRRCEGQSGCTYELLIANLAPAVNQIELWAEPGQAEATLDELVLLEATTVDVAVPPGGQPPQGEQQVAYRLLVEMEASEPALHTVNIVRTVVPGANRTRGQFLDGCCQQPITSFGPLPEGTTATVTVWAPEPVSISRAEIVPASE